MENKNNKPEISLEKPEKKESFWKEMIKFAFIALIIVIPIRIFIAQPFIVSGASMLPTFENGQYLIVDQVSYRLNEPERGDVIIFRYPEDTSKFFIKRVVGLPGEKVRLEGNDVYITTVSGENFKLDEEYVTLEKDSFNDTTLGNTEYYVLGDNRLASLDSRFWGPLDKEFIVGRAYLRLLPLNKIDALPGQ